MFIDYFIAVIYLTMAVRVNNVMDKVIWQQVFHLQLHFPFYVFYSFIFHLPSMLKELDTGSVAKETFDSVRKRQHPRLASGPVVE